MHRRNFLSLGVAVPALLRAQQGPPRPEPIETMTPDETPAIALNHLGFLPKSRKVVVFRGGEDESGGKFQLRDVAGYPQTFRIAATMTRVSTDAVDALVGDFSQVEREGMYQVAIGGELSVPFFIRGDVWRRTLGKAAGYYRYQRCGVAVPGVHPACHLDDAKRRDSGEHVDTTGGWHDAGDLRKWMSATLINGIGLLQMVRKLGAGWDLGGAGVAPVLEEVRWGNTYFLKMQDRDGQVWADVAGGVNGDNSDNHWTDNQVGTSDDRYLNPGKPGLAQAMFVMLEAMAAQAYKGEYAATCLAAAERCWKAMKPPSRTRELSWAAMAAMELWRATKNAEYARAAAQLAGNLVALQNAEYTHGQKLVRGFFRTSESDATPYVDPVDGGTPAVALLELAHEFTANSGRKRWLEAVKLYIDDYVTPMVAHSPFEIVPYGVFSGSPTREVYRELEGALTYRYFMPVRKQFWWLGTTSHLESHAVALAMAARAFNQPKYRDLARRQLEWVMGANPFGACLMTGEGMRNPYPHSRFVGLIPGGIMNGIAGNMRDEPVLDTAFGQDWRTAEYWSPHNAYYIWAVSTLEMA